MIQKTFELIEEDYCYFIKNASTQLVSPAVHHFLYFILGLQLLASIYTKSIGGSILASFLISVIVISQVVLPRIGAKKITEQNIPKIISIELTEEAVKQSSNQSIRFVFWKDIHGIKKTKRHFFIYLTKQEAIILPKRLFNRDELKMILVLLKRNSKTPKHLWLIIISIVIGYILLFALLIIALYFIIVFSLSRI